MIYISIVDVIIYYPVNKFSNVVVIYVLEKTNKSVGNKHNATYIIKLLIVNDFQYYECCFRTLVDWFSQFTIQLELHSKYHSFIYKSWSLWQQTDFTKLKSPFTSLKKISVVMFFVDIPKIKPEKAFNEMVDHDVNLLWKVRLQ